MRCLSGFFSRGGNGMKQWILLIVAACFEVCWVIGLKYAESGWEWTGTIIAIIISFSLLIQSGKYLPVGTSYAVFVGLGTAGTVVSDAILFGQTISWMQGALVVLLLVGVIGLKQSTKGEED